MRDLKSFETSPTKSTCPNPSVERFAPLACISRLLDRLWILADPYMGGRC